MPRPVPPQLGLALTLLRAAKGWTQKDLAAAIGISGNQLSQYENGRKRLSRAKLESLVAPMSCDREAVDAALAGIGHLFTVTDAETPGTPLDPSPAERRLLARSAAWLARTLEEGPLLQHLRGRRLSGDRRTAARLWERLAGCRPAQRRQWIENSAGHQTWALAERLCEESEKAAARSAAEAMELAGLALRTAELIEGDAAWTACLRGYAWAFIGNARRVGGDLPAADAAFSTARSLWVDDPSALGGLAAWRIDDLEASLRREQRQWSAALSLLDCARSIAPPQVVGRILIKKATVLEQAGELEAAYSALEEAGPWVRAGGEPRFILLVQYSQILCLCQLKRYAEAEALLAGASELTLQLDNGLDLLRVLWLKGRIAAGQDRRQEAQDALERVRTDLASAGIVYDAALVSLELAILYLEEGRSREVRELARSMVHIFRSQKVRREELAALRLFYKAAMTHTATSKQVREILSFLESARYNPPLGSSKAPFSGLIL